MTLTITQGENPSIEYASPDGAIIWRILVDSVVLLAEYTNPQGPSLMTTFLFSYFATRADITSGRPRSMLTGPLALWRGSPHFGTTIRTLASAIQPIGSRV